MTSKLFLEKKKSQQKITMLTCYDYTSARILANTGIDGLLVGDSAAMTMHGYKDTVPATVEMMCWHTAAVVRGAPEKFVITDLPFLSYRQSISKTMASVQRIVQSGAQAVKIESAAGNLKLIQHLVESGIPVMGHIGLTLQLVHTLGGFKVQGKTSESAKLLLDDALSLQQAGCFSIVLECMPASVAANISQQLEIPTIGIGAGPQTDGQILVFQDLMGLNLDFKPKFVKTYATGSEIITRSVQSFIEDVTLGEFPSHENCYAG